MNTKKLATKNSNEKNTESVNLTPEETKAKIAKLLKQLRAATHGGEKKAIRHRLRGLGHFGGLGKAATSE